MDQVSFVKPEYKKAGAAKLPPQNLEAEQSVLGSILIDKNAIVKVIDMLTPSDFYTPVHERIFETILELFEKSQPIDVVSVTNRLKEKNILQDVGGSAYIADLTNQIATASHVDHYAQIVKEKKVLRDLIRASAEITEGALAPAQNVEDLLDDIEQKILAISQKSLPHNFLHIKEELQSAYERIEKLHQGEGRLRGVPTGFTGIDNLLSGLQRSDLVIVGARPSLGKTSLALDIARHVGLKAGITVGIFSLEMSREQVIDRFVAAESNVALWKLRTGRITDDLEFQMIQRSLDDLSKASIFIDDTPSPNVMQMRAMARRLQIEHGLGLLIVDYLQLIAPRRHSENMVQQITEISRGLKGLARELNIPVLALSQLSRAVDQRDDKVPKLHDLRESGCLHGDTLIMRADTGELLKIGDLARRTEHNPIPIFTLDENLKVVTQTLVKAFSSGRKQLYELTLRSGKIIRASANHPFRTIAEWKPLEQLIPGDKIATPRRMTPSNPVQTLPDDELILLAHLLGDGCVLPRQPIHYTSADSASIDAVASATERLFGIAPRRVRQKNWWHVYLSSPYRLARGKHHPIMNWFIALGMQAVRSYEKIIPGAIFRIPNEKLALFLRHLWSTDGNVSWKILRGRNPASALYYASTSKTLAHQLQHLLLRFGVHTTIRSSQKQQYRPVYNVHIQGATDQLRFLKEIGCFGKKGKEIPAMIAALEKVKPNPNTDSIPPDAWQLLVEPAKAIAGVGWREVTAGLAMAYPGSTLFKTGIGRERMGRLAIVLQSESLREYAESDVYWDEILSIAPLGIEEVYDATVKGTHNFVANDIIVHNSIEQDADVVMFIYRKDRDKADVPLEEQNIAQILISKHRNGPLGNVKLRFDEERVSFRNLDTQREFRPDNE